jgi:pSer/pThr/pTyr-binding forkhead associated (FHA) protein
MPGVLTVREGGAERRVVVAGRAVVGRDPDCDVVLESRSVSRRHAIVERAGEAWLVRDLGSANGLFVEGRRVSEAPLGNGTALRFGDVEATFDAGGDSRPSSAQRRARSPSAAGALRTRPVAVFVVMTIGVATLVAATIWNRSCNRAPGTAATPAAAPAAPAGR